MKIRISFLLLVIVALASCNDDESELRKAMTDGFCLAIDNKIVITHKDIDYYDFSDHVIYLKSPLAIVSDTLTYGSFDVYADRQLIYSGSVIPGYSSFLPTGPIIYSPFTGQINSFGIACPIFVNQEGHSAQDPRNNAKVAEALARFHQFRE
jgi:hypothetical protein